MVQNPTGMAMTNISKPSTHESILPHLSPLQHARTKTERVELIILMASVNCLLAGNHVCLIPQLFFLCPGYCQKRSNLPKSSKIQKREPITLQTSNIQICDLEYNWSLSIAYQSLSLLGKQHLPLCSATMPSLRRHSFHSAELTFY